MAKNSLFALLLRSPWWVSIVVAALLALLAVALLPTDYRVAGGLSGLPFVVIGAIAARRQWRLPSAAQTSRTAQAVRTMAWPEFATWLERSFRRDGYTVQRATGATATAADFELERGGRRMLVCARRWKSARTGIEVLRALQATREATEAADALCICLGDLTDSARPFAAEHRIAIWQAPELAQALHGLGPGAQRTLP